MPIKVVDEAICNGCGICVAICPEDVLRLDKSRKKAVIKYPNDCVACFVCESYCPVQCIEVSAEWGREVPSPY